MKSVPRVRSTDGPSGIARGTSAMSWLPRACLLHRGLDDSCERL
jgi:hypothetical protein